MWNAQDMHSIKMPWCLPSFMCQFHIEMKIKRITHPPAEDKKWCAQNFHRDDKKINGDDDDDPDNSYYKLMFWRCQLKQAIVTIHI
jgi:hypothetical protein